MKTVLTELIEQLRKSAKISAHEDYAKGLIYAAAVATNLLEKEKKQTIDFAQKVVDSLPTNHTSSVSDIFTQTFIS